MTPRLVDGHSVHPDPYEPNLGWRCLRAVMADPAHSAEVRRRAVELQRFFAIAPDPHRAELPLAA